MLIANKTYTILIDGIRLHKIGFHPLYMVIVIYRNRLYFLVYVLIARHRIKVHVLLLVKRSFFAPKEEHVLKLEILYEIF